MSLTENINQVFVPGVQQTHNLHVARVFQFGP